MNAKSEYACVLLLEAAKCQAKSEVARGAVIAKELGLNKQLLQMVAGELVKNGVLSSVRGRYGGYLLAKPASDISISDVVNMFPTRKLQARADSNGSLAVVRRLFSEAKQAQLEKLSGTTVADLLRA